LENGEICVVIVEGFVLQSWVSDYVDVQLKIDESPLFATYGVAVNIG
jgi:hypothetical protein